MKKGTRFYRDADGIELSEDEAFSNGVLRDGVVLSVPTAMRDSITRQRAAAKRAVRVTDAFGGEAGRRPGFAFAVKDQAASDAKREAYRNYETRVTNQWRDQGESDDDVNEFFASNGDFIEGAVCTVKGPEYPDDFGAPGHIRNGICVPDRLGQRDGLSIRDAVRDHCKRMESVYRQVDERVSNAWRER
jgi:hypothetical protein